MHLANVLRSLFRPQLIKFSEKVLIPQDDYPEVNFVGLIIGPRGSTLKTLEKEVSSFSPSLQHANILSFHLFRQAGK